MSATAVWRVRVCVVVDEDVPALPRRVPASREQAASRREPATEGGTAAERRRRRRRQDRHQPQIPQLRETLRKGLQRGRLWRACLWLTICCDVRKLFLSSAYCGVLNFIEINNNYLLYFKVKYVWVSATPCSTLKNVCVSYLNIYFVLGIDVFT